jgi:AGCS family alanine or glycine:cation symporter
MAAVERILGAISDVVWGPPLLILLFGTHIFLTIRLRVIQRYVFRGIRLSLERNREGEGDISHFGALTTALAATIVCGVLYGVLRLNRHAARTLDAQLAALDPGSSDVDQSQD